MSGSEGTAGVDKLSILGFSGSLRSGSFNTALLRAAVALAPSGMEIRAFGGLRDLPHYDADLDQDVPPDAVTDLRRQITAAAGLLFVTPEYNYSVPGVLKNAIDWASRPPTTSALRGKPVAMMGASPGPFGTVRAQLALRHSFLWTQSPTVTVPEVHVFRVSERLDDQGRLVDEQTKALIIGLLHSLQALVCSTRSIAGA